MSFATILAPIETDGQARAPFQAALRLARRFGAKLDILSYVPSPAPLLAAGAVTDRTAGDMFDAARDAAAAALRDASQQAEQFGVDYEGSLMGSAMVTLQEAVAQRGMIADLIVAPRLWEGRDRRSQVVQGALFHAPAPMLVWPSDIAPDAADSVGRNILLAWDGRKPASLAARMAEPLLRAADNVTVACVDKDFSEVSAEEEPGVAFTEWLAKKGVRGTLRQLEGDDVAETLMTTATEQGADLIVMGAYGHSQMMEAIFGGVTETMLRSAPTPLFMAH